MMVRKGYRLGHTREQGFTLWEMALIVALLGVAMIIGVSAVRAPIHERQIVDQQRLLHWADKQIMAFAQINGRLPCPDFNGDGVEDCAGGATKGWLPYKTLNFQSTMPGRGVPHLKYVAYRGLSQDLSVTSATRYQPVELNNQYTSWPVSSHYTGTGFNNTNDLDLCSALEDDASTMAKTPSASSANYTSGGVVYNVAYGIAVSGGGGLYAGSLFEGLNAQNSASMEAPGRSPDSSYNDQVFVRTFASMRKALSCESVVQSVNAVAMSAGVLDDIKAQKQSMIVSTTMQMALMALGDAIQIGELADSIAALAAAIKEATVATIELVADIATCAASLGLSPTCEDIPIAAAADGFAAAGIIAAGTAIGLNAGALIPLGIATGYVVTAEIELTGKSVLTPTSNDAAAAYWKDQQAQATALQSKVNALQTTVNDEKNHLANLKKQIIAEAEKYRYEYVTTTTTDKNGKKHTKTTIYNHDCANAKNYTCTSSGPTQPEGPLLTAALTTAVSDAQAYQNYSASPSSSDSSQCSKLPDTNTVKTTTVSGKVTSGSLGGTANGVITDNMRYLDPSWIQGKFNAAFGSSGSGPTLTTPRQSCLDKLAHSTALKSAADTAAKTFSSSVTAVDNAYKYPAAYVCVSSAKPDSYNDSSYTSGKCTTSGTTQMVLQADLNNYESSYSQYLSNQYVLNQDQSQLQNIQNGLNNQGGTGSTKTGTPVSIYTSGYLDILKNVDSRGAIK